MNDSNPTGNPLAATTEVKGCAFLHSMKPALIVCVALLSLFLIIQFIPFVRNLLPLHHVATVDDQQFTLQGVWGQIKNPVYSENSAVYASDLKSSLDVDVNLRPGKYLLVLHVYNYSVADGRTRVAADAGPARAIFNYGGKRTKDGIIETSAPLDLSTRADKLHLSLVKMGGPAVLIDELMIYRRPPYSLRQNLKWGGMLLAFLLGAQLLVPAAAAATAAKRVDVALLALVMFLFLLHLPQRPLVRPVALPDGELYLGLARNLLDGTGLLDNVRHDNILPSVGHPAVLAASMRLGLPQREFAQWSMLLSVVMLTMAVRIITGSSVLALLAMLLHYFALLALIQEQGVFWIGSVEVSLYTLGCLALLCLARWYRSSFALSWTIATGVAVLLYTLARPLFLPAFYAALPMVLLCYLYRRRKADTPLLRPLLIMLAIVVGGALLTQAQSYRTYGDARLVTGTYGAIPLYCANNKYLDPEQRYASGLCADLSKEDLIEFNKPLLRTADWRVRDQRLKAAVKDFWLRHPLKTLRGWWWRLRQLIGWGQPSSMFHAAVIVFLAALAWRLVGAIIMSIPRFRAPNGPRGALRAFAANLGSFGLVLTAIFLLWLSLQALFVYCGHRYTVIGMPIMLLAALVLWGEHLAALVRLGLLRRRQQ